MKRKNFLSVNILLSLTCLVSTNSGAFASDSSNSASATALMTGKSTAGKPDGKPGETLKSVTSTGGGVPDIVQAAPNGLDPANQPMTSGRVITTSAEKAAASAAATKILEHEPGVAPEVASQAGSKRPTIALALGGGGARGAAHIGVIKVLRENNIPIDYIVGNSMGAVVGGLYCSGVPLADIQTMMQDGSMRKAYTPMSLAPKVLLTGVSKLNPFHGKNPYAGLYSGKAFRKYLSKKLPRPDMLVSETKIPFSAVATNLVDGQAYRISDGPLAIAIQASSAISPLIKPVPIGDKVYVDGGMRANLPASSARETGADIVIAVLVDEPLRTIPARKFKKFAGVTTRMADIVLAVADERQLQFADLIINPDVSGVPVLSRKGVDVKKAELAGELAARKALPAILASLKNPPKPDAAVATARKKYNI